MGKILILVAGRVSCPCVDYLVRRTDFKITLPSFGAASDHMDHVTTQLPYAFASLVLCLGLGLIA
jgi:hypothetical protein